MEASPYIPDEEGHALLPGWKQIDLLQDVLRERFRGPAEAEAEGEGGTITMEECAERLADGNG